MIDLYAGFLGQAEDLTLCPFAYLNKWTNAERYKLVQVAKDVGADRNIMGAVIKIESDGDPRAANPKSSARGLIQWLDSTAKSTHGISSYEIPNLNICAQLDLVRVYYKKNASKGIKIPGDEYVVVTGGALGMPDDHVIYEAGTEEYEKNKGWDVNKDGVVTSGDVRALVLAVKNSACKKGPPIAVTPEECPTGGGGGVFSGFSKLAVPVLVAGAAYWYFKK